MEEKKPPKKKYPEYDPHRGCDGCVDPLYMGFVSAADFKKFMAKQIYYDILFKQPLWTTELPKVEPYYSKCLKEFQDGMKKHRDSKPQGKVAKTQPLKKMPPDPTNRRSPKQTIRRRQAQSTKGSRHQRQFQSLHPRRQY